MKGFSFCLYLVGVLGFLGCAENSFKSEEELLEFLDDEENLFVNRKLINGIRFELLIKPNDLVVLQEAGKTFDVAIVDSLRNKFNPYLFLNLSISKNNQELLSNMGEGQEAFGTLVNTLSFELGDLVHLYSRSKDTIPLLDYVYPRMYGMSKSTSVLLVFNRGKMNEMDSFTLSLEDFGLNTGEIKFKIDELQIFKQPQLDFEVLER